MKQRRQLPLVVFYLPNLLGYARIILSFLGLFFSSLQYSHRAVITWILAAILDFLDGIVARWLHQTSSYGVVIDVAADNMLRSCIWISCVGVAGDYDSSSSISSNLRVAAIWMCSSLILCLEWCTMVSTQVLQVRSVQSNKKHWKKGDDDPHMVQMFFRNNFRNPMGALGIYGLYASPISLYISLTCSPVHFVQKIVLLLGRTTTFITPQLEDEEHYYSYYISVTIWIIIQGTAYLGRLLCVPIESYFIVKYMSTLATEDGQKLLQKEKDR
jgi:phosphatidylglycerophosphate synthase